MNILLALMAALVARDASDTVQIDGTDFVPYTMDVGIGESKVVSADLNNDGDSDLVISSVTDSSVTVFLGNKEQQLILHGVYPAGPDPDGLATADIDGDGSIDLLVANHETSHLTLLFGDGLGGFHVSDISTLSIDVDPHPHAVAIADVDNDGQPDILVDNRFEHGLLVLKGLGEGAFATPGTVVDVGGDPYLGMAVGDVNNDGFLDIVTPNADGVGLVLSIPSEGLHFKDPRTLNMPSPFAVGLADMNGDGHLDIIAASNGSPSRAEVMLGNGFGEFQPADDLVFPVAAGAKTIAVGDINGDGIGDAVVSSWNADVLVILGGTEEFRTTHLPNLSSPWGLVLVDLNDDGKEDIVITDGVESKTTIYLSEATQ